MDPETYARAMKVAQEKGVELNLERGVEIQTDKDMVKVLACVGCARPLVVNTFYAAKLARCADCRESSGAGSVNAPVPGSTDPALVRDLREVLVNQSFARALCPAHPDDDEHEMELKSVAHSPRHGPRDGVVGESVVHQCLKCRATVSYSTTAQIQFRRQNEVKPAGEGINGMRAFLGARDDEDES